MAENIIDESIENKEIIDEEISREFVLEKLFNAYNYGNLGMFIGAGFSKAVVNRRRQYALNWLELIKKTSEKLDLDFPDDEKLVGISLPEVATNLCKSLALKEEKSYLEAKVEFKNKICEISNWLPNEEKIKVFRNIFEVIEPKWIITTNYDLVLETILTGKCKSLSPFNYLSAPKNIIPIYHIHGTRLDSDSIIITQDDYIPLFRPNEYRQSKLAMTIRESTTLVLGYSLGDINVLSALDWSKNIYTKDNEYPYEIIQAVWTENPKDNPYRDENGNIIIEINNLENFLQELGAKLLDKKEIYNKNLEELNSLIGRLEVYDEDLVNKFINEKEFRIKLLDMVSEFEYNMVSPYIEFFTRCINKVWIETSIDGAFQAYEKYLIILLDILINYEYSKMPPRLFQIIAKSLDRVLAYISRSTSTMHYGDSWDATRTWHRRKKDIPKEMVIQLYNYSEVNSLWKLEDFTSEMI